MQLDEPKSLTKDPLAYPAFSPELVNSMRTETQRFIREVTLTQGGTVTALLTSRLGHADARLAQVYGLPGSFGSELTEVQHDEASGRLGLFTQASFLSGHSSNSTGTSPILRGVFLLRRLACVEIADPPAGAQMQEPAESPAEPILTTRQYFEWKTSMTACTGCHRSINPSGFAFEQFDGLGTLRTSEKGAPVDASGSLTIGDRTLQFAGAQEAPEGALRARPGARLLCAKLAAVRLRPRRSTRRSARLGARRTRHEGRHVRSATSRSRSPSDPRSLTCHAFRSNDDAECPLLVTTNLPARRRRRDLGTALAREHRR